MESNLKIPMALYDINNQNDQNLILTKMVEIIKKMVIYFY